MTAAPLYQLERHQEILRSLVRAGRLSVVELSREFQVSEVTIRSDLHILAQQNLLVRTHGGAVPAGSVLPVLSLASRQQLHAAPKRRIGSAGAAMIADGEAIFLDSSSTALEIARNLKQHRYLTVVTNGLAVAQELLDAPGVTVVILGGQLRRDTASIVGGEDVTGLRRFNIRRGIFGAHGLSIEDGLTDVSADEAAVKKPLVAMCRQVVAVIDHSKWGQVGLASFARFSQIDHIITDRVPDEMADAVQSRALELTVV